MTDILQNALHTISQWLLIPDMVILILLILERSPLSEELSWKRSENVLW